MGSHMNDTADFHERGQGTHFFPEQLSNLICFQPLKRPHDSVTYLVMVFKLPYQQ